MSEQQVRRSRWDDLKAMAAYVRHDKLTRVHKHVVCQKVARGEMAGFCVTCGAPVDLRPQEERERETSSA